MIRLMLLSFMVFYGVFFFVGKDAPSRPDYITQVSFDDTDKHSSLNHSYDQAQKQEPQIDLSALKNSIKTLTGKLNTGYQKAKVYFFPKQTELQKNAALLTSQNKAPIRIKTLHIAKAATKPAQARKAVTQKTKKQKTSARKTKTAARVTLPLPVARPKPQKSKIANLNAKIQNYLGIDKRPVASFRDFVTPKQKRTAHAASQTKPIQASFSQNGLIKTATLHASDKINPRFLTSLIKRELKRLNCFKGAITPSWNLAVQNRIKSLKQPLNADMPSLATLAYLKKKSRIRCLRHQEKSAQITTPTQKVMKKAEKTHVKRHTLAEINPIIVRDRSGKIILNDKMKQAAALNDDSATSDNTPLHTASLSNQKPEILFEEKDDDYAFAPQNTAYNAERPPALTVGMRTTNNEAEYGLGLASNIIARKKKTAQKRRHKAKKRKQWMNDAFSND